MSERKYPAHQILGLRFILAIDDLVFFLGTIFKLDFWACSEVLEQLGFGICLTLVLRGDLLVRRSLLRFFEGVALEAFCVFCKCLRGRRIEIGGSESKEMQETTLRKKARLQSNTMFVSFSISSFWSMYNY